MPGTGTAIWTITATSTDVVFDVEADKMPRDQGGTMTLTPIPQSGGAATVFADLAGTLPQQVQHGWHFIDEADYLTMEDQVNTVGIYTTIVDGVWNAILNRLARTKRWPGGSTDATAELVLWR
jgi:hypothetical protein